MTGHSTLSDEIERLLGLIRVRVEARARDLSNEGKAISDHQPCRLHDLIEDETKELSIMAAGYEDRGDVAMADLIRVVRDQHLPEMLEEMRSGLKQ